MWGGDSSRAGGSSGLPAPATRGFARRSPRRGHRGGGGRCGSVGGEGARTPKRRTAGSFPPRPSPLSAPHLPRPAQAGPALISPSPSAALPPWSPTPTPSPDSSQLPSRPAPGPPSCPVRLPSAGPGAPRCELGGSSRRRGARLLLYYIIKILWKAPKWSRAKKVLGVLWGAWGRGRGTCAKRRESAPKFLRSGSPGKLAPWLLHRRLCRSGVRGRHLGVPQRGMRAIEICKLQINGPKLGSGGG